MDSQTIFQFQASQLDCPCYRVHRALLARTANLQREIVSVIWLSVAPSSLTKKSAPLLRARPSLFPETELPLHVDQVLEHLVDRRDDLRVRLEAALGDDHVGELLG